MRMVGFNFKLHSVFHAYKWVLFPVPFFRVIRKLSSLPILKCMSHLPMLSSYYIPVGATTALRSPLQFSVFILLAKMLEQQEGPCCVFYSMRPLPGVPRLAATMLTAHMHSPLTLTLSSLL